MKTVLLSLSIMAFSSIALSAEDPRITTGKVAELTTHRIERLVTLKKIDASFMQRLDKVEVSAVANATPVAYKALISQTAPAVGAPLQMEMTFDAKGKFIAFKLIDGGVAGVDPLWTGADSLTLLESAMHFVLENTANKQVEPYFLAMTQSSLSKTTVGGKTVAVVKVKTSSQAQTLNIYIGLDAKFISYEILP